MDQRKAKNRKVRELVTRRLRRFYTEIELRYADTTKILEGVRQPEPSQSSHRAS